MILNISMQLLIKLNEKFLLTIIYYLIFNPIKINITKIA